MKKPKINEIRIHIFIWIIYISLPFFISPHSGPLEKPDKLFLKIHLLGSTLSVLLFYINYLWAIPALLLNSRKVTYLIFISFCVIFIGFVSKFILSQIAIAHPFFDKHPGFYLGFYLRLLFVFSISLGIQLFKRYKKIEMKNDEAELASLKAQINPHFLFNTLNGIYAQAITKSENTADSIQKLSSIMRYVITEANDNEVLLEKEITYLKNYIALQKLRLTDKTKVDFKVSGDTDKKKIAPLLLICFIENAFKYGVSNEVNSTIDIIIEIENDEMTLRIKNEKVRNKTESIDSEKIGLINAIKRMDLIYGKNYSLNIDDNSNAYKVVLKIILR